MVTIAPNDKKLYFESIKLGGSKIFQPGDGIDPGTVTIPLKDSVAMAPGEASLAIGDFFKLDRKKGKVLKAPNDVVVTVTFDDGSVATIKVN